MSFDSDADRSYFDLESCELGKLIGNKYPGASRPGALADYRAQ